MRILLRYRYFQPLDGRIHFVDSGDGGDGTLFSLVYSGMMPTDEHEPTEEILERLVLRHGTEIRPHAQGFRPIATGDVLDLGARGLWQVLPRGFRSIQCDQLLLSSVN